SRAAARPVLAAYGGEAPGRTAGAAQVVYTRLVRAGTCVKTERAVRDTSRTAFCDIAESWTELKHLAYSLLSPIPLPDSIQIGQPEVSG
ncbi:hypothetical protein P9314_09430, partial [Paenibacillus validus]|uniref:hypothetical protein n=1 Tax=Paenibacillus validus TaxID=44253 RepID=UPI002E1A3E3E|nr:hypothetical protein [Paenibacillus validus]